MSSLNSSELIDAVANKYSEIARSRLSSVGSSTNAANEDSVKRIAAAFGYSSLDLGSLPDGANMGLSCGNPIGVASLKPGETVVDLGSGGGLDVLLAAPRVGPEGRVIGLDMSDDMLALARRNADRAGYAAPQITFEKTTLPNLPLDNASADLVISNCVLNLLPPVDKPKVWVEIARILKPGGRVAISDILAKKEMSDEMRADVSKWTGCISGASLVDDYRRYITDAGFVDVQLIPTQADLSVYEQVPGLSDSKGTATSCCAPAKQATAASCQPRSSCCKSEDAASTTIPTGTQDAPDTYNVNDYAGSFLILTTLPGAQKDV